MRSGNEGLILTSLRGYGQAVAVEKEGRMLKRRSLMANPHNSKILKTKKIVHFDSNSPNTMVIFNNIQKEKYPVVQVLKLDFTVSRIF